MIPKSLQKPTGKTLDNDNRLAVVVIRSKTQYKNIMALYRKQNRLCQRCLGERDTYTAATEVHHIIPVSEGGETQDHNLLSICKTCHVTIKDISKDIQRKWKGIA